MATNSLYKYRIFCITDNKFEYTWSTQAPDVCPIQVGHSVNIKSIGTIGSVLARQVTSSVSPLNISQHSIIADTALGDITVILPPAKRCATAIVVCFKNAASNTLNITPQTDEFIDEASSVTINSLGAFKEFISDGTKWITQTTDASLVAGEIEMELSTTTNKGDIITDDGLGTVVLPVGVNDQVLMADDAATLGVKWGFSANSASNIGSTGVGIFKAKTLANLEFKNIFAFSDKVSVVDDPANDRIDIDIVESKVSHNNLGGVGNNTHDQIDSHLSNSTNPHAVTPAQIGLGNVANLKHNLTGTGPPGDSGNELYSIGSIWIDVELNLAWIYTSANAWQLISSASTTQLVEGSQLFFTDARADSRITLQKGAYNGIATLDAEGKVPMTQLSLTSVEYMGTWDASTNLPNIDSSDGIKGNYYVVSNSGASVIDGIDDWNSGDWIIYNGTIWEKADHTNTVASVAGKTGVVTLSAADIPDLTTSVVLEGSNQYYTSSRFDTGFSSKTTDDLAEGSRLYFTNARVDANAKVSSGATHVAVTSGNPHNVTADDLNLGNVKNTQVNLIAAADPGGTDNASSGYSVGSIWVNTATDVVYVCVYASATNATWKRSSAIENTDGLPEGISNVYYTDTRVDDRLSSKTTDALTEGSLNFYFTNARVAENEDVANNTIHSATTEGNPHGVTRADLGLGKVENLKQNLTATGAPGATDDSTNSYDVGSSWIDVVEDKAYICVDNTEGVAVWQQFSGTGVGEETVSNLGDGVGLYKEKIGNQLNFKTIQGGVGTTITTDVGNDTVIINVAEASINHDSLNGAGTNTHAQIDEHILSTSNPHFVTKSQVGLENVEDTKCNLAASEGPTANDDSKQGYGIGSRWIDVSAGEEYVCVDATEALADWLLTTILTTSTLDEGTNQYYTEARVTANANVAANTIHSESSGNPHGLTAVDLELENVKNTLSNFNANRAPVGTDDASSSYSVGSMWIDTTTDNAYVCTNSASGAAVWKLSSVIPDTDSLAEGKNNLYYTDTRADNRIDRLRAQPNGLASLDGGGKIPASQLSLSNVVYKGTWNSLSNSPELKDGVGGQGEYYVVSVDGATPLGGISEWKIGDWVIFNGTDWQKSDHSDAVSSVVGKIGAVVLNTDDITESSNLFYTEERVSANTSVASATSHTELMTNPHGVTKTQVGLANVWNTKMNYTATTAPTTTDDEGKDYSVGSMWVNVATNLTYICVSSAIDNADWDILSTPVDTDGLSEGSANVYYSDARVDTHLATLSTDSLVEGLTNHYYADERVTAHVNVANNTTHSAIVTGNPHSVTAADVGLGYVENIKQNISSAVSPLATDSSPLYTVGSFWYNITDKKSYACLDATSGSAVWQQLSGKGAGVKTASNFSTGTGIGIFKEKTQEDDLIFKNLNTVSNRLTIVDDGPGERLNFDVVEAEIKHDNLNGAGTNSHAQIDTHIASTLNPHGVTKDDVQLGYVQNVKSNFAANTVPVAGDDSSVGYSVGSLWIDTTKKVTYSCVDAAVDGANWRPISEPTTKVWVIRDVKTAGTNGGTFTDGAWQQRDLNDMSLNSGPEVTCLANSFILQPGQYLLEAQAPAHGVGRHAIRIFNETANSALDYSPVTYTGVDTTTVARLVTKIDIATATTYILEHRCSQLRTGDGYGQASGWEGNEIFSFIVCTYLGSYSTM